ncbi:hypothetical protein LTR17_022097 [Elasticomyces elasticus]|nr:hypothetical protein LTR17_022097 [Elasticomyces elasticus]
MFTFTPLLPSTTPATSSLLTLSSDLKILIDIGWDNGLETSQLELLGQHVSTLSLVLLTHATVECIGAYAHCCKHLPGFSRIPVYATTPVINLGRTLLTDLYASTTTSPLIPGSKNLLLPSPTPEEITLYFSTITPLKYLQPHTPLSPSLTASQPLTLTPHAAGHTLGGTIWHLHHTPDSIIYASQWSQTRENLIPGAALLSSDGSGVVESLQRPTALVCSARGVERGEGLGKRARDERLVGLVRDCVAKGGKVLIPSDSAGRMLELAFLLNGTWEVGLSGPHAETWRGARCFLATRSAGSSSMLEWVEDGVRGEAEAAMTAQGQQGGQQRGGRDAGGKVVNPMEWRHIRFLERESRVKRVVEGNKACVVLASDSSMEWGFARQALVALANDPRNLVVMTEEQSTGSGLGRQLWDLYTSHDGQKGGAGAGGAKVVDPNGVPLSYQDSTATTLLSADERAAYETYATKQRLRHSELQGDNTNPSDPNNTDDVLVDPQDEAEESSDSDDDDEGDEDAEHQGRALNLSAQLNLQTQKRSKLLAGGAGTGAGAGDAELGVNVLLRGRVVDGKGKVVGQVHDYDVRGKKGREKVFPFVVGRRRGDEFGEVVRGEEYLRAEEKVDVLEGEASMVRNGDGRGVGGKRKWGDDGAGGGRKRGDSRADGKGNKRVKRGDGVGGAGAGDDIDAAIARATGEGGGMGGGAGVGEEGISDDDEESDYDPDDAVPSPDASRKVIYTDRSVEMRCRISYVDFSALHDLRALLMIVPLMRPRKVILTAGSDGEMGSLARAFGEVELGGEQRGLEVVVGRVGVQVDASVDTNAWVLRLGRGLVRRLRWQEVKGLGVVAVTGWLGVEDSMDGGKGEDEGAKKKMKLVKGEEEQDEGEDAKAVVRAGKGERMPVLDLLATATMGASLTPAVQPTRPVHVGDTRLADLRAQLRLSGHEAQFSGEGTLLIDGCVVVRKSGDLAGRLEIESVGMQAVGGFEEVRRKVYGGLAVVGGV